MRTLFEIIKTNPKNEIEEAILIAYCAGKSEMRGIISRQIKDRIKTLPVGRYHIVAKKAAAHIYDNIDGINGNYLFGYGDSGEGEAAELLSFDYDFENALNQEGAA